MHLTQTHDFNLGIDDQGLFWTGQVDDHSVVANLGAGNATMNVKDLRVLDQFTLANALSLGASVPAIATFEVTWSGVEDRFSVRDATEKFRGNYIENTSVSIEWSAFVPSTGYRFESLNSHPGSPSNSFGGELGHERNGAFFK